MDGQRIGSAKKIFPYHNALILHKSKKQTVKDQFNYLLRYFSGESSKLSLQALLQK
jgi:hypothetical protein